MRTCAAVAECERCSIEFFLEGERRSGRPKGERVVERHVCYQTKKGMLVIDTSEVCSDLRSEDEVVSAGVD